ncbi:MAG: amidohydrolase family protein, partial [Flavisolibacter sp.]|nr:amidohydrolase family protein [Flavisolibacter sp.]
MKNLKRFFILLLLFSTVAVYAQKKKVDLIVYNAKIYTVDAKFSMASALAVLNGKIEAVGTTATLLKQFQADKKIDAKGKPVYPGFIDAHAHFYRYGLGLQTANLNGTKSWNEILDILKKFAPEQPGNWIIGRGWD